MMNADLWTIINCVNNFLLLQRITREVKEKFVVVGGRCDVVSR